MTDESILPPSPLERDRVKLEALRLGFSACGLTPADAVDESARLHFKQWLSDGHQADMAYMENHMEKRLDPRLLVEGARTVISVALNYYPAYQLNEDQYQFAWYAYGKDYHDIVRRKLTSLFEYIKEQMSPTASGRIFCDTAPVLERYWAWRSGLGWIGKNTQLILPHAGSCFFLGELFLDIAADSYDTPMPNRCGSCTRCLDACPTKAIEAPFRLNSERCLSYLTIEHRGDIPSATGKKTGNKIYGCDDCLKACPWNRFSVPCQTPELQPSPSFLQMQKEDWHMLTEEQYKTLFKGGAVKRAKYSGLVRNITLAKESQ